jgi:hypothetical protein
VLNTIREVAGLEMVVPSVLLCRFTLGNRIPRVLSSVSRMADGFGVPGWGEIFTPWALADKTNPKSRVEKSRCFIE